MQAMDRSGRSWTSVDTPPRPVAEEATFVDVHRRPEFDGRRSGREAVADGAVCLQNESVPNILVRDLPDDVHRALQGRAEQRGQSLQQYLSSELTRLAERPTVDELFERVGRRRGGKVGLDQAVADLDAERSAS